MKTFLHLLLGGVIGGVLVALLGSNGYMGRYSFVTQDVVTDGGMKYLGDTNTNLSLGGDGMGGVGTVGGDGVDGGDEKMMGGTGSCSAIIFADQNGVKTTVTTNSPSQGVSCQAFRSDDLKNWTQIPNSTFQGPTTQTISNGEPFGTFKVLCTGTDDNESSFTCSTQRHISPKNDVSCENIITSDVNYGTTSFDLSKGLEYTVGQKFKYKACGLLSEYTFASHPEMKRVSCINADGYQCTTYFKSKPKVEELPRCNVMIDEKSYFSDPNGNKKITYKVNYNKGNYAPGSMICKVQRLSQNGWINGPSNTVSSLPFKKTITSNNTTQIIKDMIRIQCSISGSVSCISNSFVVPTPQGGICSNAQVKIKGADGVILGFTHDPLTFPYEKDQNYTISCSNCSSVNPNSITATGSDYLIQYKIKNSSDTCFAYLKKQNTVVCGDNKLVYGEECEKGYEFMCSTNTSCSTNTCKCDIHSIPSPLPKST